MRYKTRKNFIIGIGFSISVVAGAIAYILALESGDGGTMILYLVTLGLFGVYYLIMNSMYKSIDDLRKEREKTEKIQNKIAQATGGSRKGVYNRIEKEESAEALRLLGNIMMESVYQEKEHDWGTLGGIAQAIGGVGAGVAVAQEAMRDNERIRAENATRRNEVTKLSMEMHKAARDIERDAVSCSGSFDKETSEKLFKAVNPKIEKIDRHAASNTVEVTIVLNDKVEEKIDGTIAGVFYSKEDNSKLATVYFNLPRGGIRNKIEKITAVCAEDIEYKGTELVLESYALWKV